MSRRRTGSIRELPNGRFEASVAVGFKVDGTPRRTYKTLQTKEEAERWVARMASEMGRRPELAAGRTVRDLWVAYEAERRGRLANSTLDRYEGCMDRRILPAMGGVDISMVTVPMVQDLLDTVPGRADARQCKSALSSMLTWAVRHGMLQENPIRSAHFTYPGDSISAWEDDSAFDDDPFAAIEGIREVWGATDVLKAMPIVRGTPLEPAWLAIVGGGARLEEAFAIRRRDVRRIEVKLDDGRKVEVTQLALHHAVNVQDGRHRTKNRKSLRIADMVEPMGRRYWELASAVDDPDGLVCKASPNNQNREWRRLFESLPSDPERRKHVPKKEGLVHRGSLSKFRYIPLSRMRATHATLLQSAGVLDSVNADAHGNSVPVLYRNYQDADTTKAAMQASDYLRVVS